MPSITGAHHTSFTVAGLERSLAFFHDLLGLEVVCTREVRGDYFGRIVGLPGCAVKAALLRVPNSGHHVELFEYVSPPGEAVRPRPCDPGSCHVALLTDDLPGLCARLREAGTEFVGEAVQIDAGPNRGARAAYVRDPNGVLVELFQPPPGAHP
ncbi:MAG TPA: VOC family protein [Gemmataceae bacterium]|nr:VOC family protein [Gemmataceae bacterium]